MRRDALWRSWEHLRQDPATGISVWLKDHCDYDMTVLLELQRAAARLRTGPPLRTAAHAVPVGDPPAALTDPQR